MAYTISRDFAHSLSTGSSDEPDIIGDVATEFVKNSASDRDIRPLNEQELWARIDHSIEQADRGEVLTLEETMESIDQEFEL